MMTVQTHREGDVVVAKLIGKLDNLTGPPVEAKLVSLIEKGEPTIILDCSEMEYLSSAGLRVLILAHNKQTALGHRLIFIQMTDHISHLITVTGLDRKFDIRATLADATA